MKRDLAYRRYSVSARDRQPLVRFILDGLIQAGCLIGEHTPPTQMPFRVLFVTPNGERMGIIAYAFRANEVVTRNRPTDEHRFQVKYGKKESENLHHLYQDPGGVYTTLLLGINPDQGYFVGADAELHNPTKFFIMLGFKQHLVDEILTKGWASWRRESRRRGEPMEVLVGGTPTTFLRYIRFERAAFGESQERREALANDVALELCGYKAT